MGLGLAHFDEKGLEQLGSLAVALASHEPQLVGYGELMAFDLALRHTRCNLL